MTIETKLDFKKYLGLIYILTYRKPMVIILTISGWMALIGSIFYISKFKVPADILPYSYLAVGLFIVVIIPVLIYWKTKRNFYSHSMLQEKIVYEFSDQKIKILGESFSSEMDWTKIYMILELKNWILIYHSRVIANVIPKESFGTKFDEFRTLIILKNIRIKPRKMIG